jgi:hypothetical protein
MGSQKSDPEVDQSLQCQKRIMETRCWRTLTKRACKWVVETAKTDFFGRNNERFKVLGKGTQSTKFLASVAPAQIASTFSKGGTARRSNSDLTTQ